jgi:dUTP pyrophosphatase
MVFLPVDPTPRVHVCFLNQAAPVYGEESPGGATPGFAPSTATAVGIDLRACFNEAEISLEPGARAAIPSGVSIEPVTPGIAGFVYSRSGLGAKHGLVVAQGVGVIDPDYRGEIIVWLLNTSGQTMSVKQGERIAQLVFQPYVRPQICRKDQLSETGRGSGGFGHTGQF